MQCKNHGTTVDISLHDGPTVTHAWDVLEEAYGSPLDEETLRYLASATENASGYPYMTDKEKEDELWKIINQKGV